MRCCDCDQNRICINKDEFKETNNVEELCIYVNDKNFKKIYHPDIDVYIENDVIGIEQIDENDKNFKVYKVFAKDTIDMDVRRVLKICSVKLKGKYINIMEHIQLNGYQIYTVENIKNLTVDICINRPIIKTKKFIEKNEILFYITGMSIEVKK